MRETIEAALQENWGVLFSYALRLSGSRDAAGDIVQSCALKALSSLAIPTDATKIKAWLFAILRNTWIDGRRHRGAHADELSEETAEATSWSFDDRLIAELTVRQGLMRLDPAHREIIELVDLAGFRYAEAAAILEVPVGTVMSRLSRARLALLACLEAGDT